MHDVADQISVAVLTFFKVTGLKAVIGAIGACLLFLALPPVDKDGSFNQREFAYRLSSAGVFSTLFGDWAVNMIHYQFPALQVNEHPAAIYLLVGAPAWWVTRLVATALKRREGRDIKTLWREIKGR